MTESILSIGILGSGRVGTALARLAAKNDVAVSIASRAAASELQFMLDFVAPSTRAASIGELVEKERLIILAIPSVRALELDPLMFADKILIDATNYWEPTDGRIVSYEGDLSSSEVLQVRLNMSRLVKTFNHIGYHEMDENARPAGATDRQALGIAGNDAEARADVAALVNKVGFDPVDAGQLSAGRAFQPGGSVFGHRLNAAQMEEQLRDGVRAEPRPA